MSGDTPSTESGPSLIARKLDQFERREREIARIEKKLVKKEEEIEISEKRYNELLEEQKTQLEKISGLTAEQAKELLIRAMENEARYEGAKLIKRIAARPAAVTALRKDHALE